MARTLLVLAAALVTAVPAGATTHASLSLVRAQPLTVRGNGFVSGERVVLRIVRARVAVRATRSGRFVATFTTVDRCTAGRIVATGTAGDYAILRLPPIECPPS